MDPSATPETAAPETASPDTDVDIPADGNPGATGPGVRPLRADARRNVDKLLGAARHAFAAEGEAASLEDIARRAGVGIGTLYRHFPTRQALVEAVYLNEIQLLRDEGVRLLEADDPFDALASWLRAHLAVGSVGRSLAAGLMAARARGESPITRCKSDMCEAGAKLLTRAQAAGTARTNVEFLDVLRMVHGIVLVNESQPDAAVQSARMLDLVIAGLRA